MTLNQLLQQIAGLPWRFAEMDNDKVVPTLRLFGRRKHDPSKELCFGRLDSACDASYACHAANTLPDLVEALRLLLADQRRPKSELSRSQFEFCEAALAKAQTINNERKP